MKRHELSDKQWDKIKSVFPNPKRTGRPPTDNRQMVNAIMWILKTGAQWRDLPKHFGPWQTVYNRLRRWCRDGIWYQVLRYLQSDFEAEGRIDWELFSVDGSVIRAHQSAAGAKKTSKYQGSLTTTLWDVVKEGMEQRFTE